MKLWKRRFRPGVFVKTTNQLLVRYGVLLREITLENGRSTELWEVKLFPDNEIQVYPLSHLQKVKTLDLPEQYYSGVTTTGKKSTNCKHDHGRKILDATCCICGEQMCKEVIASYPCGHALHAQCFMRYHQQSDFGANRCPICRKHYVLGEGDCTYFGPVEI